MYTSPQGYKYILASDYTRVGYVHTLTNTTPETFIEFWNRMLAEQSELDRLNCVEPTAWCSYKSGDRIMWDSPVSAAVLLERNRDQLLLQKAEIEYAEIEFYHVYLHGIRSGPDVIMFYMGPDDGRGLEPKMRFLSNDEWDALRNLGKALHAH